MSLKTITKTGIEVVVKNSINGISEDEWDSLIGDCDLYRSYRFLKAVEEAKVENANFWYILIYSNEILSAAAVCSAFDVSLDMFTNRWIQAFSRFTRKVYPKFIRPKMLFCGLPVSIGKHSISCSDHLPYSMAADIINEAADEIALKNNVKYIVFKEFCEPDTDRLKILENYGYIKAESVPRHSLEIKWNKSSEYLNDLRSHYKRKINKSLKLIEDTDNTSPSKKRPSIVVRELDDNWVDIFYNDYLEVMKRVEKKLEVLNKNFFVNIDKYMKNDLRILSLEDETKTYGSVLLGKNGEQLNFLLISLDYEYRDKYETYFNLLFGIVSYAIDHNYKNIDLGQTTGFVKKRFGATAEKMYFYIKPLNKFVHYILNRFNRLIFPGEKSKELHLFKTDSSF